MSEDDSEKTQEATPERRRKAREEGQFPRSKDSGAIAASFAVLLGLVGFGEFLISAVHELSLACFQHSHELAAGGLGRIGWRTVTTLGYLCLPLAVLAMLAALAMGFLEAGFQPRLELAAPKFNRLEPLGKLKNLFSPASGMANTALSLARVTVVAGVAYGVLSDAFPMLSRLTRAPLAGSVVTLGDVALRLTIFSTLALAALAGVDYTHSWFKHEKQIRMSQQEVKDEFKNQEGDPQIKQRQRQRARELAKRGIAKELKSADVVVTNPTHVAVALRYRASEGAPVVVAKGYDDVAQYIKKLASEYGIVAVENVPLARALADKVRVGKAIPVDFYAAVAEVLAFVYRVKQRGLRG
jgi:flagellar biosynthetic protein FlhB